MSTAAPAWSPPATAPAQRLSAVARPAAQRTYLGMAWRRFQQNRLAMAGLVFLVSVATVALAADVIAAYVTGHTADDQQLTERFAPIGDPDYLLGADDLGRDTATRLIYGARVSLGIGLLSILAALAIGSVIGMVAGFRGGWIDAILMRAVDVLLAIPGLFLLLLVTSMWRVGPATLAFVIAAFGWLTLARLVRGEVLIAREREYVLAARVSGGTNARMMWRHIMPNALPVIIVWVSLTLPALILTEASLSYLGLGIQPPTPSWGNMLSNAQRVWGWSPALAILPGLAIYLTVFSINLVGKGLRDALDPRLMGE